MNGYARKTTLAAAVIGTLLAGVLATSAPARDAAGSSPPDRHFYVNPSTGYAIPVGSDSTSSLEAAGAAPAEPETPSAGPSSPNGFDWPSAVIGAAAGAALLITLGAVTNIGRRRGRAPLVRGSA